MTSEVHGFVLPGDNTGDTPFFRGPWVLHGARLWGRSFS